MKPSEQIHEAAALGARITEAGASAYGKVRRLNSAANRKAKMVIPSAQASPALAESVCMVVPRSATPTVPPIWRVELRSPEARPEVSGADEINTPAVIAGMIMPILVPSNPRPIGIGHNAILSAAATSTADPIAPRARPRQMRGRKYGIPFL
jgi:hypothetical protein